MMRAAVCVLFVLFASGRVSAASMSPPASSSPVSFDFAAVPVMQFAQSIYRDALGRDFVVSSDLVDSNKRVSVKVKALPADRLAAFVDQVLRSQGVGSVERDGVFYLDRATDPPAAAPAASAPAAGAPGAAAAALSPHVDVAAMAKEPDVIFVTRVENRSVEFVATVLNGVFGPNTAKVASGASLVVSVQPKRENAVRDVLAQIDTVPKSVEVLASFVEVRRTESEARGLALVSSTLSRKLGASFDVGAGQATISAGSYQLVLDALAGDGHFRQVSSSRVVGDEGERLSLQVGDETPTVSSSGKDNQGNAVQNIVYRPSGVILDVLPKVTGSGRLALAVDGQVSSFQSTTNGVANSPTLVKREVKTAVSLADGQVLVIGGLDDTKATTASSGFSFLPSTWRARSRDDQKTDLVLILTARVIGGGG